jgi:hypothetical protein
VPVVLTPLKITVTRLTVDGMLVKSIDVPLVDATAVPALTIPDGFPVKVKLPVTDTLFTNVAANPVVNCIASYPPTCIAADPSEFAFSPVDIFYLLFVNNIN